MFKSILFTICTLFTSSAFAVDVVLPAPVKAQTGLYTITNLNDNTNVALSGVQLEVYEAGETFFGSTTHDPYVFGTVFIEGMWYTLQSDQAADDATHPTVKHVVMGVNTGFNGPQLVGHGILTFDPTNTGDAHTVMFQGTFDVKQFYNFLYLTSINWKLSRSTNVQIDHCALALDFGPPNISLPCN